MHLLCWIGLSTLVTTSATNIGMLHISYLIVYQIGFLKRDQNSMADFSFID